MHCCCKLQEKNSNNNNMYALCERLNFSYIFYSFVSKNTKFSSADPKPPGINYPILGSLPYLTKDPHKAITKYTGDEAMLSLWMGDYYTIVVSDPALVKEIWNKNFDIFSGRVLTPLGKILSGSGKNILTSDYENWKPIRSHVSTSFTKTKLKQLNNIVEDHTRQFVNCLKSFEKSGLPLEPNPYLKKFSMNIILMIVFSKQIPYEESVSEGVAAELISSIEDIFKQTSQGTVLNFLHIFAPVFYLMRNKVAANFNRCKNFIEEQIYKEKLKDFDPKNPKDLFEELMIEFNDTDTVLRIATDLLLGGTDTTSTTMHWFLWHMANYPEIQEKMYQEIVEASGKSTFVTNEYRPKTPYFLAVLKEIMRIKPTAPLGLNRRCDQDIVIGGYFIPKGTQMLTNQYGIMRNEKYFPKADQFLPERFMNDQTNDAWIPFGIGQRNCIGLNLAMDELYIGCTNILMNFKISSYNGKPIPDEEVFGVCLYPKEYQLRLESR
ncbi:cytochrome P450 family protein [Heterostelium album PN500]|uniref:Cytochrome P450 family protein n=1 Tax=Heterostelium pallidum (strain ATCC 26659 / Pp 5 / PN500) TaxID=670386 RepID=D3BR59_HETP5|nr:cytochrome P450 family protein [Heterostelium album PN500]EFA75891.1 cytochrome P450 family protein [Heterostelium album PN500]|eukprot:XP_020428025.1 cytochrome P450 family protein [Heterostelium album PN500]